VFSATAVDQRVGCFAAFMSACAPSKTRGVDGVTLWGSFVAPR
jgi:hypothetical protein